jgi:cytochrome c biogenesis protein CcmG/thiol:disulfide interchange protein DsbE
MKKYAVLALPFVFFTVAVVFLLKGLFSDPRQRDSSLLDNPLPPFSLPDVMNPEKTYANDDFANKVVLLNVWGTWCVTCAVEIPFLTRLRQQGVMVVGLYYEQDMDPDFGGKTMTQIQAEITQTLGRLGNPYQYNILDVNRDYSLDLGVTGAPETFLIDKSGVVRLHHIGDVNERVWQEDIQPIYEKYMAE